MILAYVNLDLILVVSFLVVNFGVGLWSGKGITSMQGYALGGRRFSIVALTSTVIAAWISGSIFSILVADAYQKGILHARLSIGIGLFFTDYILALHISEFFGKFSIVAEIASDLYSQVFKVITAFCSIMISVGFIVAQIKVLSFSFTHFFIVDSFYAMLLSSIVVILYSAFGGFKSVIFTDIFQFLALGIFASTIRAVSVGLLVGCCAIIILWKMYLQDSSSIDSVVPATFANFVCLYANALHIKRAWRMGVAL